MRYRRKAREVALQILFQKAFHQDGDAMELFKTFADRFQLNTETRDYALLLTAGVTEKEGKINELIEEKSDHWNLDRMAMIDKILLQIAILELRFSNPAQTTPKLTITDIIDLAKKYSSEDSKRFINGILNQVYTEGSKKS